MIMQMDRTSKVKGRKSLLGLPLFAVEPVIAVILFATHHTESVKKIIGDGFMEHLLFDLLKTFIKTNTKGRNDGKGHSK